MGPLSPEMDQADRRQRGFDTGVDLRAGKPQVLRPESGIFPDRFAHDLGVRVLENHADPLAHGMEVSPDGGRFVEHLPGCRREEAVEMPYQDRLPRAVSSHDG
jgi:hypothetical protein